MSRALSLLSADAPGSGLTVSLHGALRDATQAVHQRLHRHAGFAAVQDASIGVAAYRRLLGRLYGFYAPFEAAAGEGRVRSRWLEDDLGALGRTSRFEVWPRCAAIPALHDAQFRLGAFYMAEGSALGGRSLARGLDRLLGGEAVEGRRFFLGRGAATGPAWRGYLAQLAQAPGDAGARAAIVSGAVETFRVFEHWLSEWNSVSDDPS